jgi:hypothetical protein
VSSRASADGADWRPTGDGQVELLDAALGAQFDTDLFVGFLVALGASLFEALRTGSPDVHYYKVRQPIDPETGKPEPYAVDQFDLHARRMPGR